MAERAAEEDLRSEVRRLAYRLDEAREQLGSLRIRITACSELAVLVTSLLVPMYAATGDGKTGLTDLTLGGMAGRAGDYGLGSVKALAVIAFAALILTMLTTLASIFDGDRRIGWAQGIASALLLASWVALMIAVDTSERGGFAAQGFHSTARTVLIPAGAVTSLVALRVARQVRD